MEVNEKIKIFLNKLESIYPSQLDKLILALSQRVPLVFRFTSNIKKSEQALELATLTNMGFKLEDGPITGSYVVTTQPEGIKLTEQDLFKNHKIYIQSLSSMLPALVLKPSKGDKVLDMCAAPGSKASQIAVMVTSPSNLTLVENNRTRFFRLKENLEDQGIQDCNFLMENAVFLPKKYPNFVGCFDKILLDAPCSNETTLNPFDSKTFLNWNPKTAGKLSQLQKKLLYSGLSMLSVSGTLVYSTCTFSVEENEEVVNWALSKFPRASLVQVEFPEVPTVPGLVSYKNKDFNADLTKTTRVLPNRFFTPFYIAKFIVS